MNLEQDFKAFYFKEYNRLVRVSEYIVKDFGVAEDVVQEVFVKLWERKNDMTDVKNLGAYVHQMTKNISFDKLKNSRSLQQKILELQNKEEFERDEKTEQELKQALGIAVSKLPPKCRLIFSLSRFEGLSNDEIAEYLDISKRTVEKQISNALKAFRTDLRPVFENHLSVIIGASLLPLLQQL